MALIALGFGLAEGPDWPEASTRADEMSGRASQLAARADDKASDLRRGTADFYMGNPLVGGLGALAAGAVAGAALPMPKREEELLQPVSDELRARGTDLSDQVVAQAKQAADLVRSEADAS